MKFTVCRGFIIIWLLIFIHHDEQAPNRISGLLSVARLRMTFGTWKKSWKSEHETNARERACVSTGITLPSSGAPKKACKEFHTAAALLSSELSTAC